MSGIRVVAIILIMAGVIGLVYQQFSFTRETAQAKIGPLELSVKQKGNGQCQPMWLSIGAIGLGVGLLVMEPEKVRSAVSIRGGYLPCCAEALGIM